MRDQIHQTATVEDADGLSRVYMAKDGAEVTRIRINPRVNVTLLDRIVRQCVETGQPVAVSLADAAKHGLCGLAAPIHSTDHPSIYVGPDFFANPERVREALMSALPTQ